MRLGRILFNILSLFIIIVLIQYSSSQIQKEEEAKEQCSYDDQYQDWCTKDTDLIVTINSSINSDKEIINNEYCNIESYDANFLSQDEFLQRFGYSEPVVIKNLKLNTEFRNFCSKQNLLKQFGTKRVTLSSANTYSYSKVSSTFHDYITRILRPQNLTTLGNETMYLFGDIDHTEFKDLLSRYTQPPYILPGHVGGLSFGIAGSGTGVPFHFHGPGFGEVIYGRKKWFLYPYNEKPEFNPDNSTLQWYIEQYPNLPIHKKPLECVLRENEVIYFPDRWWHATLNMETSVFMSTFLGPIS